MDAASVFSPRENNVGRDERVRLFSRSARLIAAVFCLCGCVRYVPPLSELNSDAAQRSPSAFQESEHKIQEEKAGFLKNRLAAVRNNHGEPTYIFGPGDVIDVQVFGFPDLSGSARVRPSGSVSLPLIQELSVAGLTEDETQRLLTERLKSYVRDPRVKVSIQEYRAHRVSILGAVARPGEYPLRSSDYTLLDLLSEAGGRSPNSGRRIVLVPAEKRRFDANASAPEGQPPGVGGIEFEVEDFYGDANTPPIVLPLVPGDTVIVPETGTFTVLGDVKNPGAFPLSTRASVLGAIGAAGGLEYSADVNKVELIRDIGSGRQAVDIIDLENAAVGDGRDIELKNGDRVRVPSTTGRYIQRQVVEFLNGLLSLGYSAS